MILTITLNPSIDISYPFSSFRIGEVNRVQNETKTAGGKGLNVSRVLNQLNSNILATGVVGGYSGEFIKYKLSDEKINHNFFVIKNETRYCISILHNSNQTEVLESGPQLTNEEVKNCIDKIKSLIPNKKVVTISGSMAKGFPIDTYQKLITSAINHNCKVLLDASGENLKQSLICKNKPYLIKPNIEELNQLLSTNIKANDFEALKASLNNSIFDDIKYIVISLGENGAIVKVNNDFFKVEVPKINPINPVGSGDSTIAGFAYAIDNALNSFEIIKYGMACGVLNALNPKTGYINVQLLDKTMNEIRITNF